MFRRLGTAIVLVGLTGVPHTVHSVWSCSTTRLAAKATALSPINIKAASGTGREGLPEIGPKTARRIIECREKNGPPKMMEERPVLGAFCGGPRGSSR